MVEMRSQSVLFSVQCTAIVFVLESNKLALAGQPWHAEP